MTWFAVEELPAIALQERRILATPAAMATIPETGRLVGRAPEGPT